MGGIMLLVGIAGLWAPDTDASATLVRDDEDLADPHGLRVTGQIVPRVRAWALAAVGRTVTPANAGMMPL